MLIAYVPALICILGLFLWFHTSKLTKVGEYMFFCGLFVTLLALMRHTVKLF